jgi:hypothetical protein
MSMTVRACLANQLKIKFELPPDRPTELELDRILSNVEAFERQHRRLPTEEHWRAITLEHVRFNGTYFYRGSPFRI